MGRSSGTTSQAAPLPPAARQRQGGPVLEFFLRVDQAAEQGDRAADQDHRQRAADADPSADPSANCAEAA